VRTSSNLFFSLGIEEAVEIVSFTSPLAGVTGSSVLLALCSLDGLRCYSKLLGAVSRSFCLFALLRSELRPTHRAASVTRVKLLGPFGRTSFFSCLRLAVGQ
jgi:hypothetical protein